MKAVNQTFLIKSMNKVVDLAGLAEFVNRARAKSMTDFMIGMQVVGVGNRRVNISKLVPVEDLEYATI